MSVDWELFIQWILFGFLILVLLFIFIHQIVLRIIRKYHPFPIPGFATRLIDNPIRRIFVQRPNIMAERMQLEPGMIALEIGPGKGSYTKAVAKRLLPGGKVYAIDIQESVVKYLQRRVEKENISNIIPKVDDAYNLSFEDESIDRIFAIGCLPEIPDPVRVLREFKRVLKPDGLVSLCELFPDPDYPWRRTEVRWAEEAGLKLRQQFGTWFTYQLNFGKRKE
ncbi:MAG: class I SAM-dependent methyltransferase [Promethearchaeota archaeon]